MDKLDLLITGIGGQGIIAASDIVSEVALSCGLDVKKTDSLGMAQRGGSVVSHIRCAHKVWSPLVKAGEADIMLALEKLEAARWSRYLKHGGIAIVNNLALPPLAVSLGGAVYPPDDEITGIIRKQTDKLYITDGSGLAAEMGNTRTLNSIMLGCLSLFATFPEATWKECIAQRLPDKVVELNLAAFEHGRQEMQALVNSCKG
jgi:indolepyruvate ferredoxin oxidoreductase beta subunit